MSTIKITTLNELINYVKINQNQQFNFKLGNGKFLIIPNITQDWDLIRIIEESIPPKWQTIFNELIKELYTINETLTRREMEQIPIFPLKCNIFNVFYDLSPQQIRVVILGQDPYYNCDRNNVPYAHGYAFSTLSADIPSSLQNIFKEIRNEYRSVITEMEIGKNNGNLMSWVRQGVFLLNTALTVEYGKAGSHLELWRIFSDRLINYISYQNPRCIFLLLGNHAKQKQDVINKNCDIITTVHPSGQSANRGFFGCNCFKEINRLLTNRNEEPIQWW